MMLTSSGEYGDQSRCADLGIRAYLTKPVYAADLLVAIERAIGTRSSAAPVIAAESKSEDRARPAVRSARILLVEDNVVNQRVASGLLTRRGHQVTVVADGVQALAMLDRETFDLVLMDLQMPVMGGIEATLEIRQRERVTGQHVRVVAMTAHAMHGDRERCLAAGMDGYLSKPINPPKLFAIVEEQGDENGARPSAEVSGAFDEDDLRRRLSGDDELLADVIRMFVEDLPVRLTAIADAVTVRNPIALRAAAHALKGVAGNVSANRLSEAASVLELIAGESRMDAADGAWHHVSVEASHVLQILRARVANATEPCPS
jgi:CheY-like chemotaxis protein